MLSLAVWLFVLVSIEVAAELVLERYGQTHRLSLLVVGVLCYMALALAFASAIRNVSQLVVLNTMWQCLNIACIALFSTFVLHEKPTVRRVLGVLCALVACALMA